MHICCHRLQKAPTSMEKQPLMSMILKVHKVISICVMCCLGHCRVCLLPMSKVPTQRLTISVVDTIEHDWHGTPLIQYFIRDNAHLKFQIMIYPRTRCDAYLSMKFFRNKTLCKGKPQFNTPWIWRTTPKKKGHITLIAMGVLSMTPLKIGQGSRVL